MEQPRELLHRSVAFPHTGHLTNGSLTVAAGLAVDIREFVVYRTIRLRGR